MSSFSLLSISPSLRGRNEWSRKDLRIALVERLSKCGLRPGASALSEALSEISFWSSDPVTGLSASLLGYTDASWNWFLLFWLSGPHTCTVASFEKALIIIHVLFPQAEQFYKLRFLRVGLWGFTCLKALQMMLVCSQGHAPDLLHILAQAMCHGLEIFPRCICQSLGPQLITVFGVGRTFKRWSLLRGS